MSININMSMTKLCLKIKHGSDVGWISFIWNPKCSQIWSVLGADETGLEHLKPDLIGWSPVTKHMRWKLRIQIILSLRAQVFMRQNWISCSDVGLIVRIQCIMHQKIFPKLKIFSWKVLGPKETQDKWPSVVPISVTKHVVVQRFSESLAGSSQPFSFHSLP